ncbi:MAG: hypothetical protein ABWZ68_03635, partial [Acidimicrobiales bacterium]
MGGGEEAAGGAVPEDLTLGVIEDPPDRPGEQGQDEGVEGDHGAVVELVDRPFGDLQVLEVLDGCVLVEEDRQEPGDELGGAMYDQREVGGPEVGGAGVGGGASGHLFHGVDPALAGGAGQLGGQGPAAEPVGGFGDVFLVFGLHEPFELVLPEGEGQSGHPGVDLAVAVQGPRRGAVPV